VRLKELCVFEWQYDEDGRVPDGGFVLLRPYGGEEGCGYGEGRGSVSGERIRGSVVWSNHPHRRSDARMLPDVHGLVVTDDGARIVFELHGRTVFNDDRSRGGQTLVGAFESDDDRYTWLNDVVCIAEGTILPDPNRIEIHVYAAINELIE
jgi:sugar lactone lactonase YvrE